MFTESQLNEVKAWLSKSHRIEPQRLESNQIDQHQRRLDPNKWNWINPGPVTSQNKPPHIESAHIESQWTKLNQTQSDKHEPDRSTSRQIESSPYPVKQNHWLHQAEPDNVESKVSNQDRVTLSQSNNYQIGSHEMASHQIKAHQTTPNQIESNRIKPHETKWSQIGPKQIEQNHIISEESNQVE